MSTPRHAPLRLLGVALGLAAFGAGGLLGGFATLSLRTDPAAPPTAERDDLLATAGELAVAGAGARVTVHEGVLANLDASGKVDEAAVRTQLEVAGEGASNVTVPVGTQPRRTDGFAGPDVRDGQAAWEFDLDDGQPVTREVVSRLDAEDLPLAVRARYELDGEPVSAARLTGATGQATIRLQIRNLTAAPTDVVAPIGRRVRIEERDVAVPFVVGLSAEFDDSWSQVEVSGGSVAPAGRSGTQVAWSGVLIEPLGAPTVELAITGEAAAARLPAMTLDAAPIRLGADSALGLFARELEDRQIDGAVLAFSVDGVGDAVDDLAGGLDDLAGGLAELADGTGQAAGGVGTAAQGSSELAGGLAELERGTATLASGLDTLAEGSTELAGGADTFADGVSEVSDAFVAPDPEDILAGLAAIPRALDELAEGAREIESGAETFAEELREAFDEIDPDAFSETAAALRELAGQLTEIAGGLTATADGLEGAAAGLRGADGLLDQAQVLLEAVRVDTPDDRIVTADGLIDGARDAITDVADGLDDAEEAAVPGLEAAAGGLGEIGGALGEIADGLDEVDLSALDEIPDGIDGIAEAVGQVAEGADGIAEGTEEALEELAAGLAEFGVFEGVLADLADGAADLAEGAGGVAEGTRQGAAGVGGLAEGTGALATGAAELSGGLFEAAGGLTGLTEGVEGAAEGGDALAEGAEMLAGEGIDPLAEQIEGAEDGNALTLATVRALDARAAADADVFGLPADAEQSAAYRYVIDADAQTRAGIASAQLVGAIVLLVTLGGLEALRRRISTV